MLQKKQAFTSVAQTSVKPDVNCNVDCTVHQDSYSWGKLNKQRKLVITLKAFGIKILN